MNDRALRHWLPNWTRVALAALAVSAGYAIVLVVLRSPLASRVESAETIFPRMLVVHVQLAFAFWMLAYGASRWSLSGRGWLALGAQVGIALVAIAPLLPSAILGDVVLANYLPVLVQPMFIAGGALFAFAVLTVAVRFLVQPRQQRRTCDPSGWLTAAAVALLAAVLSATLLPAGATWTARAWNGGHVLQFAYMALAVECWWRLLGVPPRRWLAYAARLYWVTLSLVLLWATAFDVLAPLFFTQLMQWVLWPLPLGVLTGMLLTGWPLRWPLLGPQRVALVTLGLFTAGCALGATLRGDGMLIPAHYHAVLGALTAAFLGQLCLPAREGGDLQRAGDWASLILWYVGGKALLVIGLVMIGLSGGRRKAPFESMLEGDWLYAGGVLAVVLGGVGAVVVVLWLTVRLSVGCKRNEITRGVRVEHG